MTEKRQKERIEKNEDPPPRQRDGALVQRLRGTEAAKIAPPREVLRRLQRHSVSVTKSAWDAALGRGGAAGTADTLASTSVVATTRIASQRRSAW